MTPSAVLTRQARRELARSVRVIAQDDPSAAGRLNDAVLEAARLIGANPALGHRRADLAAPRYRFWPLPRHRHVLVYTDATSPPRILRVLHTSRDLPPLLEDLRDAQSS